MNAAETFMQFVVVGRGTLAVGCCRLVVERGLALRAVVSDDEALKKWARSAAVACLPTPGDLAGLAWEGPVPVLLSIGNEQLLPAAILERFAHAINFHDGPLPRYAGSHVTSWALIARERTHAVTWHRMTDHADAGDILLQVPVPMAYDETALTLNAKCHDAALASFPQLMDRLARGDFTERKQNPAQRAFFARDRRPERAAILDWHREADELSALVRALSFGPCVNRLGLPRMRLGEAFVTVEALDVCAERSASTPGTLVSLTREAMVVATLTHDVRLRSFLTLDGHPLSIAQLVDMFALCEGDTLPACNGAAAHMVASHACGWKHEAEWMESFKNTRPVALPLRTAAERDAAAAACVVVPALRSRRWAARTDLGDFSLIVILAYLARANAAETFDIGLRDGKAANPPPGCDALLALTRPFRVTLDFEEPFDRFRQDCLVDLANWRSRKPYFRDAVLRYPGVARPAGWDDYSSWPVVVDMHMYGAAPDMARHACAAESSSRTTFAIAASTGQVALVHNGLQPAQLVRLSAQLTMFADDCWARPHTAVGDLALLPRAEVLALRSEVWGPTVGD